MSLNTALDNLWIRYVTQSGNPLSLAEKEILFSLISSLLMAFMVASPKDIDSEDTYRLDLLTSRLNSAEKRILREYRNAPECSKINASMIAMWLHHLEG